MRIESPCLTCNLRSSVCHGECKAYKEFREKKDKENSAIRRYAWQTFHKYPDIYAPQNKKKEKKN